jgi:hypothetical protein
MVSWYVAHVFSIIIIIIIITTITITSLCILAILVRGPSVSGLRVKKQNCNDADDNFSK